MKVVIYSRVSTQEQTVDNQLLALQQLISRRDDMDLVRTFQENVSAWETGKQDALQELLSRARLGQFDAVIVWSLDRLTRGGALQILSLIDKLKKYRVKVISLQEPWTEAPGEIGDILYAITGWVAGMESRRRSERTRAGLERAKADGKTLGRPVGSHDKKKRKTAGYRLRHAKNAKLREGHHDKKGSLGY